MQKKISLRYLALFSIVFLMAVLIYSPGLNGPFLFDDSPHITQNPQVQIHDLSMDSLIQAWNSSLTPRPWHRPLAQLSFGINHAFSGLSPFAFKSTNLIIHLLNGVLIFLLSKSLISALLFSSQLKVTDQQKKWFALGVCAVWLLHPLNLTSVLYVVQRMTELSALFILLALWIYTSGRLSLANNKPGFFRLLIAFPVAGTGLLAKENAVLFPLFLLILEITLLRGLPVVRLERAFQIFRLLTIYTPLVLGLVYLITHPELYGYDTRSFSLEERVLTQFRALWFYLQLFLIPSPEALGFFHDDFSISKNIQNPASTLPAVIAWVITASLALVFSRRLPVIAFGVLFFLAAHSLESSILPLEMVFEHRNYVAIFGPAFALSYLLTIEFAKRKIHSSLMALMAILCLVYSSLTLLRATDWRDKYQLALSEVAHHPDSPRANFKAAQLYIGLISSAQDKTKIYSASRKHLEKVLQLDPGQPNSLFGLIVLNLYMDKPPENNWIDDLTAELRDGDIGPTRLSISQFTFLVRWHIDKQYPISPSIMRRIFDAALENRGLNNLGRASILAARRAYHNQVLNQPETAILYARKSAKIWPDRWHYQKRLVQLAIRLSLFDEAEKVLKQAITRHLAENHLAEADNLFILLKQQRAKLESGK